MKKEDIKNQEDYRLFWEQEVIKKNNKEITKKELNIILKEAIKITQEQEKKAYLEENEDILCNNCGESLLYFWGGKYITGLKDCEVRGGYWTPGILEDLVKYKFNLCEKCLKKIFNKFEIPVEEKEYDPLPISLLLSKEKEE